MELRNLNLKPEVERDKKWNDLYMGLFKKAQELAASVTPGNGAGGGAKNSFQPISDLCPHSKWLDNHFSIP